MGPGMRDSKAQTPGTVCMGNVDEASNNIGESGVFQAFADARALLYSINNDF